MGTIAYTMICKRIKKLYCQSRSLGVAYAVAMIIERILHEIRGFYDNGLSLGWHQFLE